MIRSNADRYPVSAQCEILGVARATYYYSLSRGGEERDPLEGEVVRIYEENRGRYGARRVKAVLARRGKRASHRRIGNILKKNNLTCIRRNAKMKAERAPAGDADLPNIVTRGFDGRAPRTRICPDLTYVRMRGGWSYVCLLVGLCSRQIVEHAAGSRKDARLVRSAFATLDFPIPGIEASLRTGVRVRQRADRRDAPGPRHKAVVFQEGLPARQRGRRVGQQNPEGGIVYQEVSSSLHDLQVKLSSYVHWHNHERLRSTLGYMSPVELREAGMSL